jgi:hypothetical protein
LLIKEINKRFGGCVKDGKRRDVAAIAIKRWGM